MEPTLPISNAGATPSKESQRSSKWKKFLVLWLRLAWRDLLTMIVLLVIAYFFKTKVPVFRHRERTFAMWRDGPGVWHGETYISHTKERLILSNLVAGLVLAGVPIAIVVLMQIFIKNFWDANTAIFGLVKGLVTMYVWTGMFP